MSATVMLREVDGKLSPETAAESAARLETAAARALNLEQMFALLGYRDIVCHGDESTFERCLARCFIFEVYTPEAIERIVINRIAHSHSRPDGRSAPLRFDDLNALLRQIREQAQRG